MNPLLSALCTLLLLAACTNRQSPSPPEKGMAPAADSPTTQAPAVALPDTKFRPGFFTSFPDTIDGCSSYFTYDTTAMEKGSYIFLSNYSDLALIKVGGKDIYLHKDPKESRNRGEEEGRDVYRGEGYTITLDMKKIRSIEEVIYYTGSLRITGNGIDVQYRVHGEAGC